MTAVVVGAALATGAVVALRLTGDAPKAAPPAVVSGAGSPEPIATVGVDADAGRPARVQIFNGVGTPGAGELAGQRLTDGGFEVFGIRNASSFDVAQTRILIYAETTASLAAAERVRALLGAGTIQVSRQPQSVIDLSVVLGADLGGDEREQQLME